MSLREFFESGYERGLAGHKHFCKCNCCYLHCFNDPCPYPEFINDFVGFEWHQCLTEYISRRRKQCPFCNTIYHLRLIDDELQDEHKCDKDAVIWRAELRIRKLWRRVVNHMLVSEAEVLADMVLNSDGTQLLGILEDAKKVASRLKLLIEEHKETENKV